MKLSEYFSTEKVQLDFIVANAAVGYDGGGTIPSQELAEKTLKTNVDSTIAYINSFLPFLSPTGRIVVIASEMAALNAQTSQMQQKLSNKFITESEILAMSREYIQAAKDKSMENYSWSAYGTSKAMISAWARFVLRKKLKEGQSFVCMHPGWCSTDMGGSYAPVAPKTGA